MERATLYRRIDERVEAMLAAGLLGEVETLLAAGFRDALTAQQAIGYKELVPVVEASASLDEAVAAIKQASRRYAKRQLTWFRADPRIVWLDVTDLSLAEAADEALTRLCWQNGTEPMGE
jgi:tRNA dimethylallyltransferase